MSERDDELTQLLAQRSMENEGQLRELLRLGMSFEDAQRLIAERQSGEQKPSRKPSTLVDLAQAISTRLGTPPERMNVQERVNVTAPRPTEPWGNDPRMGTGLMESITLGSASKPPTGVHLPPTTRVIGPEAKNLPPPIREVWDEARAKWPYISRYVQSVRMDDTMPVTDNAQATRSGEVLINPNAAFNMPREELLNILAHELVHVGQNNAFPTKMENIQNWRGFLTPYNDRLEEQQAYSAQFDQKFHDARTKTSKKK